MGSMAMLTPTISSSSSHCCCFPSLPFSFFSSSLRRTAKAQSFLFSPPPPPPPLHSLALPRLSPPTFLPTLRRCQPLPHPQVLSDSELQDASECSSSTLLQRSLLLAASSGSFLLVDLPASAETILPENWVQLGITWGICAIVYFIVIPLIVFNYLRLRWYKRNMPETFFQFLLVFVFFPGMLLLAPFINFRPLPKDPSKAP